jgi:hypothetical protein
MKFIIDDNLKKIKRSRTIVPLNYTSFRVTIKIERKIITSTQIVIKIVILFDE